MFQIFPYYTSRMSIIVIDLIQEEKCLQRKCDWSRWFQELHSDQILNITLLTPAEFRMLYWGLCWKNNVRYLKSLMKLNSRCSRSSSTPPSLTWCSWRRTQKKNQDPPFQHVQPLCSVLPSCNVSNYVPRGIMMVTWTGERLYPWTWTTPSSLLSCRSRKSVWYWSSSSCFSL